MKIICVHTNCSCADADSDKCLEAQSPLSDFEQSVLKILHHTVIITNVHEKKILLVKCFFIISRCKFQKKKKIQKYSKQKNLFFVNHNILKKRAKEKC